MKRTKLLVLFGGQSTEHEISCISAGAVLKNTDLQRFNVKACGITKEGDWIPQDGEDGAIDTESIVSGAWAKARRGEKGIGPALDLIYGCDVVFPVMHGIMAEDGSIQGLFAVLGKPCVGAGILASAVCMDKVFTKTVLKQAGIPVVPSVTLERTDISDMGRVRAEIASEIGYPCFVKPSNSGSSVGAFKVLSEDELDERLAEAAKFDRKILVEKYINAKEIECAVLGNRDPKAATPGEIITTGEFYDYNDKYINGTSSTRIPADISEEDLERIRALALKAFTAIDCAGFARVDFFKDRDTGDIYLNEINTIPGFTSISMYPKMWEHEGMPMKELITNLVELAIEDRAENAREF
ncbi:MAG: D-alanine--D-alanine ligase [Clostridia bacterium]|nr:D-alanine--D-alanine ligase [Clostridia bacterium]